MGWRTWTAAVLVTAAVACSDGGDNADAPELPPEDCRNQVSDGCLTLKTRQSGPRHSHFHLAMPSGEPVDQYGIAHTLYLGPGSTFTRAMKRGTYVLHVYRGRPPRRQAAPPIPGDCARTFGVRTGRTPTLRIEWRGKSCGIVRARPRR